MAKLNYFAFVMILLFIGLSFFVILFEPHNLKYTESYPNESKTNNTIIEFEEPNKVDKFIMDTYESVIGNANNYKKNGDIDEKQYLQINEFVQKSLSDYIQYKSFLKNKNYENANRSLYASLWAVVNANILTKHHYVQNCITSSLITVKKYKPFFFFLRKEDRDIAFDLKQESNQFDSYAKNLNRNIDNIVDIISNVKLFWNIRETYDKTARECTDFKEYIQRDYNYQNFFFKFKIVIMLILFLIGFVAGKIITMNSLKKIFEGLSNFGKEFNPKNVKEKTIENILKLDSLIAVLVTLIALISTIGFRDWKFISTLILCVISLLVSILLGIMSINNNSEKQRRGCYILFLLGLLFFIVSIIELIMFIEFSFIVASIKQALFTNSTIV